MNGITFNPNMMSLNDLAQTSPMGNAAMGIYGSALSPEMKQQMMPMGMMNRTGQEMMGQQQPNQTQGMTSDQMSAMRMMAQGIQGMGRGMQQQIPSGNTAQIIRDQNQFRFPQQQMAQALRNRG